MIWHPTPIRTLAMPRRSLLTASQRQALLALPTGEEDLERYWSLSDDDLAVIRRRRRPPNRQLTGPLDARQTARLEALLALHAGANINALAWVRQPEGVAYRSFALLIERLEHLRSIGLDPNLTASVHPERGRQLYESRVRLSAQHLRTLRPVKRRAILVATVIEATVTLSDAAASMFERLVGKLFRRARASARSRTNSCSVPSSEPCARPDRCRSRCRTILERGSPTVGPAWPDAWLRSRPRLSATRLRTCAWTAGVRASRRRGSSRPSTGRAPLPIASRRPHHRAAARGRSPDRLLRCLHPPKQWSHDRGSPRAADRYPRGRDELGRNTHGRRLRPRHPPSARMDRRMAPAQGQLRSGANYHRQRAAPSAARALVRRWHTIEIGRTELPARPARRGDRGREPAQGIRTRRRVLHPCLRHLRALPLQGSSPHPQARRHTHSTVSCITPPT